MYLPKFGCIARYNSVLVGSNKCFAKEKIADLVHPEEERKATKLHRRQGLKSVPGKLCFQDISVVPVSANTYSVTPPPIHPIASVTWPEVVPQQNDDLFNPSMLLKVQLYPFKMKMH